MTPGAQILAPPAAPGESTHPWRWLTLMILLLVSLRLRKRGGAGG